MPKYTREHFNFWSAYVDVFSNMLAFLLMVGLIAATSGGALSGSQHACAGIRADDSDLSRAIFELAIASGLTDPNLEPSANCEIALIPTIENPQNDWQTRARFLRFPSNGKQFCWKAPTSAGCERTDASDKNVMDELCKALKRVLNAIVEQRRYSDGIVGYRVALIGHASSDWTGTTLETCSNGMLKSGKASDATQAQLLCNYQLSLERAQSAAAYCRSTWAESTDEKDNYDDILTLSGESYLSSRVRDAVGDSTSVPGSLKPTKEQLQNWGRQERRLTVSVYVPNDRF